MFEVTSLAEGALGSALAAARRFDPEAGLRAIPGPTGVSVELAREPEPGDQRCSGPGYTLWVAPGLDGVLDVGDHDRFILRPPGSQERTVR
jgi:hypothetical protein